MAEGIDTERHCTFVPPSHRQPAEDSGALDLSGLLEESTLTLRKDVPLELVVDMFQKMVRVNSRLLPRREPLLTRTRTRRLGRTCCTSCSRRRASSWGW